MQFQILNNLEWMLPSSLNHFPISLFTYVFCNLFKRISSKFLMGKYYWKFFNDKFTKLKEFLFLFYSLLFFSFLFFTCILFSYFSYFFHIAFFSIFCFVLSFFFIHFLATGRVAEGNPLAYATFGIAKQLLEW